MNAALIHDKMFIKNFWEGKIDRQSQKSVTEEMRMEKSALTKLRQEWVQRLEFRTKHLKKINDDFMRKVKQSKVADQS
ncbi:protein FAM240B [Aplochiton taeniatus]